MVLRETILGRELFDFAFKTYTTRWMNKRPTPADLFRTLEEASGVDLDWFWRGWFYTTDHVDIAIDKITRLKVDTRDPDIEKPYQRKEYYDEPTSRTDENNAAAGVVPRMEAKTDLKDFYKMLWTVEAKHGNVFVKMALNYFPENEVYERLEYLMTEEGKIVEGLALRAAVH